MRRCTSPPVPPFPRSHRDFRLARSLPFPNRAGTVKAVVGDTLRGPLRLLYDDLDAESSGAPVPARFCSPAEYSRGPLSTGCGCAVSPSGLLACCSALDRRSEAPWRACTSVRTHVHMRMYMQHIGHALCLKALRSIAALRPKGIGRRAAAEGSQCCRCSIVGCGAAGADPALGERLSWARTPNGDAERDLQPSGYARANGRRVRCCMRASCVLLHLACCLLRAAASCMLLPLASESSTLVHSMGVHHRTWGASAVGRHRRRT